MWIAFIASGLAQSPADSETAEITAAWAVEVVPLKRWSDSDTLIGESRIGEKVEILSREGDLVRIRRGAEFGCGPCAIVAQTPCGQMTLQSLG